MTVAEPGTMMGHYDRLRSGFQGALFALLAILLVPAALAGPIYDQGLEAFQFDRLEDAALFFAQSIATEEPNARAYRYLGLSYEQLGRLDEARETYSAALDGSIGTPAERARIAMQLGLMDARSGDVSSAVEAYNVALSLDNTLATAYLNRANAGVVAETYAQSIADYRIYLSIEPATPQKAQIERMIQLLTETVDAERIAAEEAERQRQIAEEAQRAAEAEAQRKAEQEAQAVAERRANMLSSVLDSLNNASDTLSFEMENEDIKEETDDIDIVD